MLLRAMYRSFPVQLFLLHFKQNQFLLLGWILLLLFFGRQIGTRLGIPYLFLDPEYLHKVSMLSFLWMGLALGILTLSFHMTCYVLYSRRYDFVGMSKHPFLTFALNNSLLPLLFHLVFVFLMLRFHLQRDETLSQAVSYLLGYATGSLSILVGAGIYFGLTNKNVMRMLSENVSKQLRHTGLARRRAMFNVREVRAWSGDVDYYLSERFRWRPVSPLGKSRRRMALQVLDQNHLNLLFFEIGILGLLFLLGALSEMPHAQLPASATVILILTVIVMLTGATMYWLGKWGVLAMLGLVVGFFLLEGGKYFDRNAQVLGLSYRDSLPAYTHLSLKEHHRADRFLDDKENTKSILYNWRKKFSGAGKEKPLMVFLCASSGGARSAIWVFRVLRRADSLTRGRFFRHAALITGSSGGMIGAAYYRKLYETDERKQTQHRYAQKFVKNVEKEALNPVIFSFLVNDLLSVPSTFRYASAQHRKGRALALENALNHNLEEALEGRLGDYLVPEREGRIPMMILSPTLANDGRKLYISPHGVSYMAVPNGFDKEGLPGRVLGVDYRSFFEKQHSLESRFLSLLRINASFPYVTPAGVLPSVPAMHVEDAGLSDNYGMYDAGRFMYVFKDWIRRNTSRVLVVSIRDSPRQYNIIKKGPPSLVNSTLSQQDIRNDDAMEKLRYLFRPHPIEQVDLTYFYAAPSELLPEEERRHRASLSWRLTRHEKESIQKSLFLPPNQTGFERIAELLRE